MRAVGKSGQDWSRRDLGRAVVGGAIVAGLGRMSQAEPSFRSLLDEFRRSLRPDQRQSLILAGDDPRRSMVQNNWAVVPSTIADLTATQQELALALIQQVCTPEGFARLTRARDDDSGGWKHDHLAVFESPDNPKESGWVVTGRHLTLHVNAAGAIISGPMLIGHSKTGAGCIWREPMNLVSDLLGSLDDADRERVFGSAGLKMTRLKSDHGESIRRLLLSLTGLFRAFAIPSVETSRTSSGGPKAVIWQGVQDSQTRNSVRAWRLIGPGWRWSFHAEPHPHAWFDAI